LSRPTVRQFEDNQSRLIRDADQMRGDGGVLEGEQATSDHRGWERVVNPLARAVPAVIRPETARQLSAAKNV
jgi:hypothetical protein